jgi:hypothetical protein
VVDAGRALRQDVTAQALTFADALQGNAQAFANSVAKSSGTQVEAAGQAIASVSGSGKTSAAAQGIARAAGQGKGPAMGNTACRWGVGCV